MRGFVSVLAMALLVGMFPAGLVAQPSTLDSLISVALDNNPDLGASAARITEADYTARAADVLPDPMITIGAMNLPVSSMSLSETPMSGVGIGISQKIPWPSTLGNRGRIADLNRDIQDVSHHADANRLVRQLTAAYYEYAYLTYADSSLIETDQLLAFVEEITEIRYANGKNALRDLLTVQSQRTALQNRRSDINAQRRIALKKLRRLIGATGDLALDLPAELPEIGADNTEIATDLATAPVSHISRIKVDRASSGLDLARSSYWPDFTLGLEYRIRRVMPGDPVQGDDFISFKAGFTLPLWFFARQNNQTRAAKAAVSAAKSQQRSVALALEEESAAYRYRLDALQEKTIRYDRELLPQAESTIEAARIGYEVGSVDFDGLLAAYMTRLDRILQRLQLVAEYHQTTAALKALLGTAASRGDLL